ncbi:hypothetical protein [Marinovum sp. B10]|uniref:hypothetical protein n=1 Tax=Marinovum sp. B10 TaxID=3449224 RepID=UPI003EDBC1BA
MAHHIDGLEILEVNSPLRPVPGNGLDFIHQRFRTTTEDVSGTGRDEIVPEIVDCIRSAAVMVHNDPAIEISHQFIQIGRFLRTAADVDDSEHLALLVEIPCHRQNRRDPDTAGDEQVLLNIG